MADNELPDKIIPITTLRLNWEAKKKGVSLKVRNKGRRGDGENALVEIIHRDNG